MIETIHQAHNRATLIYSLSRLLERASYYGLRSLIVLYMVGETIKMSQSEALSLYGLFTGLMLFSRVLGALIGDLLFGNKKTIIAGGIIQAVGAFILCIPSLIGLYTGITLIVIGGGLYTPNLMSCFGKLYLNKTKLLDSGFTILYLTVNVGAIVGSLLIGSFSEFHFTYGFFTAGILFLVSILLPIISKENSLSETTPVATSINQRAIKVSLAFLLGGLFWACHEVSNIGIFDLEMKFIQSNLSFSQGFMTSLNSSFILPVNITACIVWTYVYRNQFVKLTIGFVVFTIALSLLFLIPESLSNHHIFIYAGSMFFLAVSEIYVGPVIHSVLTKYSNPKYLATMISLSSVPIGIFSFLIGRFGESFYELPSLVLKFTILTSSVIALGLLLYVLLIKKSKHQQSENNN